MLRTIPESPGPDFKFAIWPTSDQARVTARLTEDDICLTRIRCRPTGAPRLGFLSAPKRFAHGRVVVLLGELFVSPPRCRQQTGNSSPERWRSFRNRCNGRWISS